MAIKKEKKEQKKKISFLGQLIWLGVLSGILIASGAFLYISKKLLPDTAELENPKYKIASTILASNGEELGKFYVEDRVWVPFEELNPNIINALVATEDERYFSHSGIDPRGILRAVAYLGKNGGASTITQQLAKQFFTEPSRSFHKRVWQKLKEWVIAVEFEKRYTKEEIIAMYLNKFDYIYNAIGIGTAAKTYFGKDQKELEPDEAAVLVGMLKNPYYFNPIRNPQNSAKRKSVVLKQMVVNKYLSKEKYKAYSEKNIDMSRFKRGEYNGGLAPYFRNHLDNWVEDLLSQDQYKKGNGSKYDRYTDGLKITTTIDPKIQQHAEDALRTHMSKLQATYFNRWKNKDPWTYRADKEQKAIRASRLSRTMRESERFIKLRQSMLAEVSAKIYDNIPDSRLLDNDIFRLFSAEKDKRYLDGLIKSSFIHSDQKMVYNKILKSEYWPELKNTWNALKMEANKVFDTPVKMMVFDFETGNEKEVRMSPLDSIKYHQQMLQLGSVALDPKNGHVLSWVGGIGYNRFKFDHVTSNRQVGSTFKPFIYGTAIIDLGMSPCQEVQDVKYCIPAGDPNFNLIKSWCPDNSDKVNTGKWYTLRQALKESMNSVSVYLMKQIGNARRVRSFVGELGVDVNKFDAVPSMALGVPELSALDMATAYTAFANNGIKSNPIFVTKIEDKNGRVIYTAIPEQKKVINPAYNYVIVDMLKYVASGILSNNVKSEVAGKTGTTNDYKDGWFVGFTPEIVVATWVGGDNEWIRFMNIADGQGAVMARPFFQLLLQKIEADESIDYNTEARFLIPEDRLIETNCERYKQVNPPSEENSEEGPLIIEDEFDEDF